MADIQPPPTWAEVATVDEKTGRTIFNPVWLKWFIDLTEILNNGGGTALNHNLLNGLQGGAADEYYHLDQERYTEVTGAKSANIVFAGPTGGGAAVPEFRALVAADLPTGTGTVTSVNVSGGTTGLTTSGGPITTSGTITLTGTLNADNGGTGFASYAVGDILYAATTTTLAKLADVATGNAVISGGVGVAPSWGKIGLTTHVSGTLPIGNGGTNSATALSGSSIMISNGSAVVQGAAGTTTTVLHGNASGAPTYGAVTLTTDVTGTLPVANGGTSLATLTAHALYVGNGTSAPTALAVGASNTFLKGSTGADPAFGTATLASADFANQGTTTTVLHGNAAGNPSFGAVSLTADTSGVLPETKGGTNQSTYTTGDIIYSSATNTLSKLAGNITTTKKFLRQTGSGAASAAPAWDTVTAADVPGSALTRVDDTNVTLTLGGSPTTALLNAASITAGWTGTLGVARGGTNIGSYAIGDIIYASGATTLSKLADVATGNALISGGVTTAPSWGKIGLTTHVSGTLPVANGGTGVTALGALTKVDDTNVTLTLGGSPTTALVNAASITAGWTGTLAINRLNPGALAFAASYG